MEYKTIKSNELKIKFRWWVLGGKKVLWSWFALIWARKDKISGINEFAGLGPKNTVVKLMLWS